MSRFPSIKCNEINSNQFGQISKLYKLSYATKGMASISVTKYGGIHSSGKIESSKCYTWEFMPKNGIYIVITLIRYPKGYIFHGYIPEHINNQKYNDYIMEAYTKIKTILEEV